MAKLLASHLVLKLPLHFSKNNPLLVEGICRSCGGNIAAERVLTHTNVLIHPRTRPSPDSLVASARTDLKVMKNSVYTIGGSLCKVTARNFSTSSVAYSSVPSLLVDSTAEVINVAQSNLFFQDFLPVYGAEKLFEFIHNATGLPWWVTIVASAFLLRVVVMLPLTIHSFHNEARLQQLQPEVTQLAGRLKQEVGVAMYQFKWSQKRAKREFQKNFRRLVKELHLKHNCHPFKGVAYFWVQLPVWISVSFALRNMSIKAVNPFLEGHDSFKDLAEQGVAWCPNLTDFDGIFILPVMMGAVTLLNTEMQYLKIPEVTTYRKWLTYGLRGVALVLVPVCAVMPSGMVLYWISSSMFNAAQVLLFEYSPFRRLVGLPKSQTESCTPIRTLGHKMKLRYWPR